MQSEKMLETLVELIRRASSSLPSDVEEALADRAKLEENSRAAHSMRTILDNVALARKGVTPICQDTGVLLFEVDLPVGQDPRDLVEGIEAAVRIATSGGVLRQNTIDSLSGASVADNVAPGSPQVHFSVWDRNVVRIRLMLKGGGCENVGAQYGLPNAALQAGRDIEGVRRVVLDAVMQAQGRGCAPGILGVCVGGDRASGYATAKKQLWRALGERSPDPVLSALELRLLDEANQLGIGPMGTGGRTTLLDVKIGALSRLPASYFVSVAYMCWAARRAGVEVGPGQDASSVWLKPGEMSS